MSKKPKTDNKTSKSPKSASKSKTGKRRVSSAKKETRKRKTPAPEAAHPMETAADQTPLPPRPELRADHEQETVVEIEPAGIAPYDETLLDVCRTRWQLADWEALARVESLTLRNHPQRAKIALLVAAAHFQLGRNQEAQRFLQSALDWGASHRQAVQILMSGVHHCLAEAHGLLGRAENAHSHHLDALRTGGVPGDAELLARVRLTKNPMTTTESWTS